MKPSLRGTLGVSLAACALSALAQQNSAPPSHPPRREETVVLSPFVVSTTGDTGYRANDTLSGTRIRSSLDDIPATIQVATKEIMQDIGANNAQELLVYMTGTEVKGPGGNIALPAASFRGLSEDDTRGAFRDKNRVRGLAPADITRNLFLTDIPFDGYNTDRIEINRGANASLFGLGSPAGIINQSTSLAQLTKNLSDVELRGNSNGGARAALDFNRILIPDRLALRFAALHDDRRYEQREAFTNDRRLYLAGTYAQKFFKHSSVMGKTTLRSNFETIQIRENTPNVLPPVDGLTMWFTGFEHALLRGVPTRGTWNNTTDARVFWAPDLGNTPNGRQQFWVILGGSNRGPVVIVPEANAENPFAGMFGSTPLIGRQPVINNGVRKPDGTWTTAILVAPTLLPDALSFAAGPAVPEWTLYQSPTLRDTSIFDFRRHTLLGPNRPADSDFKVYNVSLEQTFLDDRVGIELAYDRQEAFKRTATLTPSGATGRIYIDINETVADGSPNPNFGRPFVAGQQGWGTTESIRSSSRLTGFVTHDFARHSDRLWAKWLGRHALTGVYNEQQGDFTGIGGGVRVNAEYDQYGRPNTTADWEIPMMIYLGPRISDRPSAAGANIPAVGRRYRLDNSFLGNGQFLFRRQTAGAPAELARTTVNDRWVSSGSKTRQKTESTAFILQSHLLDGLLVGTASWRRDAVQSWVTGAPLLDSRQNALVYDSDWRPENYAMFRGSFSDIAEESTSYGAVLKAPRAVLRAVPFVNHLSLSYNESSNFQVTGSRRDIFGNPVSAPTGENKDYGLRIRLLDNKLAVNITRYETNQANVGFSGGFSLNRFLSSVVRVIEPTRLGVNPDANRNFLPENAAGAEISIPQSLADFTNFRISPTGQATYSIPSNYASTQDLVSKGTEVEVIYNPTRHWRIALNVTEQTAEISNVQRAEKAFWERTTINVGGTQKTIKEAWTVDFANVVANTNGIAAPAGGLRREFSDELNNTLAAGQALNGQKAPELRRWRANFLTRYDFGAGKFKGFSVGGGARWEGKVAIGGPVNYLSDGTPVTDVTRPYYGPSELRVDLWVGYERKILENRVGWSIRLQVRNALDDNDLIPIYANPDGYAAVQRIPESRTFLLTSKFSF